MKREVRRSFYRFYIKTLHIIFNSRFSFILFVAVTAAVTFKFYKSWPNREPANIPIIYDHYRPTASKLIPEYMDSLKED